MLTYQSPKFKSLNQNFKNLKVEKFAITVGTYLHLQDLAIKLVGYHVVLWVASIHQLLHVGVLASTVYSARLLYP